MKIILSAPRGFCAGVERAIEVVNQALDLLPHPIYVNHEIVHNSHVVNDFKDRGVVFVEGIDTVPAGSTLIFNAHGVSPSLVTEAKNKNLKIIDATCPLVNKVHFEALRYKKENYQILLIGHKGHAEVIGVMGEAPDHITIVESADDVAKLNFTTEDKLAYITQTTLSVSDCAKVIKAIKERYPQVAEPKKADICYATTNRQHAIKILSEESDTTIIVGSPNSSNSNRLREVAEAQGNQAYLVNDANDLELSWFNGEETISLSAGASTPEHIVQAIVTKLKDNFTVESISEKTVTIENEKFSLPKF